MHRRWLITLLALFVAAPLLGCDSGSQILVRDDDGLDSGAEVAEETGEIARQVRAEEGTVLYATSRNVDPDEIDDEYEPQSHEIATVYLDAEGQVLDSGGHQIDPDVVDELSGEPLEGKALRVVIDPDAEGQPVASLLPLMEAIHEEGAFVEIATDEAPAALDHSGDEPDDEQQAEEDIDAE